MEGKQRKKWKSGRRKGVAGWQMGEKRVEKKKQCRSEMEKKGVLSYQSEKKRKRVSEVSV